MNLPAWSLPALRATVELALREDLGAGDLTTDACIDPHVQATAHAVARTEIVACGGPVFAEVFRQVDPTLMVTLQVGEGVKAGPASRLWSVSGPARSILMGERVALNFVQRMSGVATQARRYVEALPAGSPTRVTDTRKTTPGLRALERYAVRAGGAHNHRDNLGAGVLIKDNHVVAAGGVANAVKRARDFAPHSVRIECEVDSLPQLDEALGAGVDAVLLDNMDLATLREAVRRVRSAGRPVLAEASGGVTLGRIPELAATGVDVISVGALTHSVMAADIGLDFDP